MNKRNISLDMLKVLACFSVILLHVTGIIANNTKTSYTINHTLYYSSVLAVPVFFMVNGYLLLNKKFLDYKYIFRKIIHILLVVFCWNLIIFILRLIANKKANNPIVESIKNLVQKGYFWQFWFFGAVIIIYMVLPIIYKYFQDMRTAVTITSTFVVLSLVVDIASIYRSLIGQSIIQVHVPQVFRLWTWFAYYLLGGLIGKKKIKNYIIAKISMRFNINILIISFIVINIYQYVVGRLLYNNTYAEYYYDNIFVFIFVLSAYVFILRVNFKENVIINLCSKNIMGIYIIHVTMLKFFKHFYPFDTSISNIILIFIIFISSLIASVIISKIPKVNRIIEL